MSLPRIALSDQSPAHITSDALIVGIAPGPDGSIVVAGDVLGDDHAGQLGAHASSSGWVKTKNPARSLRPWDGLPNIAFSSTASARLSSARATLSESPRSSRTLLASKGRGMRVSVPVKWSVGASSLLALVGCQASEVTPMGEDDAMTPSPEEPAAEEITTEEDTSLDEASESPAGYADGSYQSSGGYQSPNGAETIEVSITVTDGAISAVEVTPQATNSTSQRYQGYFAGGIAEEVVGKSLDEAEVSRVAGSSLTSGGFAEALESIRQDAKAS